MTAKDTAIKAFDASRFPLLVPATAADALEVIKDNLGEGGLSIADLDRITVPPGGGTTFEIPTVDGDTEPAKELVGIIILSTEQKAYWAQSMEEAPNSPPICFSHDRMTGTGDPMETGQVEKHSCATCPKNEWGTSKTGTGKGKACRDLRPLFLLREGEYLPIVVSIPRKSLKHVKKYMARLAAKGIPYYGCLTRFTLNKVSGGGVPDYTEITPSLVEVLSKENRAAIKHFALQLHNAVATQTPAASSEPDYSADPQSVYDPLADAADPMQNTEPAANFEPFAEVE